MSIDWHKAYVRKIRGMVQHFDENKYWKYREKIINARGGVLPYLYLLKVKKMDAYNNASIGINIGFGAEFDSPPKLPHGMYGIIIHPYAKIGKNVTIFHQVTIGDDGRDKNNVPTIEDDVVLYPGCKIVGKCTIGKGAKIGANCVVSFDIPPYATVTLPKPIVRIKNEVSYCESETN